MPEFRSRPEQYPVVGALGRYLQKADEFARKPFGYENPPAALISDFLQVPPIYRTMENINYGTPITQGRGETYGLTGETKEALTGAMNFAPLVPAAARMVKPLAKAAAPYAARHAVNLAEKYGVSPTMNVIKPKGGNWLKGNVDESVSRLKQFVREPAYVEDLGRREATGEMQPGITQQVISQNTRAEALNKWIESKLTKYLSNEMATAEDPIRLSIQEWPEKREMLLAEKQKQIDKAVSDMEKARAKRGFTPEMMTQSQARIRELNREKALIENRTGSHLTAEHLENAQGRVPEDVTEARKKAGEPIMGHTWRDFKGDPTTRARAEGWENIADKSIDTYLSGDLLDTIYRRARTNPNDKGRLASIYGEEVLKTNPWLEKVSLETPVYHIDQFRTGDMGLDHIADELQNAMRPGSDLPEHLRVDPKKLDKMSVPQVVDIIDQINAWRATQQAEASLAHSANAATVTHKEYPNAGLKWVELKLPEGEGGKKALEDALKYEGDTLKHCVGGYCDSVVNGYSRIFSLRDAEGRPHATIEVQPVKDNSPWDTIHKSLGDEKYRELHKDFWEMGGYGKDSPFYDPDMDVVLEKFLQSKGLETPKLERIEQIKGSRNGKPSEEVLPFVQDFVRSGEWRDVNDLRNADLAKIENSYLSEKDLRELAQQHGYPENVVGDEPIAYWRGMANVVRSGIEPGEQANTVLEAIRNFKPEGFAQGGSVNFAAGGHAEYDDDLIRQMAAELVDVQQERAAESGDIPEPSLLDSLRNMSPLGGHYSAGPFALDAWTNNRGVNLRGSAGTDHLRGYVDVDPRQKKVSQLGVTYEDMNPRGGYQLSANMDPETREKTLNAMYRKQLSDGSEFMVGGTHRPDSRQTMLNLMYRYGFAQGGAVHMEKGGSAKRKEPSPFDDLEPTFGDRMGAWVSDKVTEGAINLYDKLSNRDRMSAAHKIYLDTFARDKRDPITASDFNAEELSELQNLIRQKEKLSGGKGKGYIEYKDYDELTGGNRRKGVVANLIGGVMPPRPSLSKALGQFNYQLDPKTKQYKIIDEYDFNPQQTTYQDRKIDIPLEHYGDYLGEMSPYALARLYGGRKMPPGTGRKVELSVPYAKGGAVEFNPDEIDEMAAQLIEEQNG